MSSSPWFCLVLLAVSSHALPHWPAGVVEVPLYEEVYEERPINLHHSLKKVHEAAVQVMEDLHGSVHQKISQTKRTIAMVHTPVISPVGLVNGLLQKTLGIHAGLQVDLGGHHNEHGAQLGQSLQHHHGAHLSPSNQHTFIPHLVPLGEFVQGPNFTPTVHQIHQESLNQFQAPQFDSSVQHYSPPINSLTSTVQKIVDAHLESTMQQHLAAHLASSGQPHLSCPGCAHSLNPGRPEVTHNIHLGQPQITITSNTHVEISCSKDKKNCPASSSDSKEQPPATSFTQTPPVSGGDQGVGIIESSLDSDVVFTESLKNNSKSINTAGSENGGIDIRFGNEDSKTNNSSKNVRDSVNT